MHTIALLIAAAAAVIRPEAIRAHVRFLADDLLEGRGTGTRGHEIAAQYVAAHFETLGLEPAGGGGSFLQDVPLVRAELDTARSSVTLIAGSEETKVAVGQDCIVSPNLLRDEVAVDAPVVFVGYGISAPEHGWDDYKDVDVRGKIVAYLRGAPDRFDRAGAAVRAMLGDLQAKERHAIEHGAVGLLRIFTAPDEKIQPWARLAMLAPRAGAFSWIAPNGTPDRAHPELRASVAIHHTAAAPLFAGSGRSMTEAIEAANQGPYSLALRSRLRVTTVSRTTRMTSPNVVAVLRGGSPALRDQHVVYTAHLDHLGIGPAVNGDSIYNGALDNASGTSGLMEIARAFASLRERPARSILFLVVTAEERGLLGSDYFVHHPTVPLAQIVANINIDGMTRFATRDVVARGAEHSSLIENVRRAAATMQFEISPDPTPEQVLFIRSDQYSFVKKGVPSLYVGGGIRSVDPALDLRAIGAEWRATRYHLPSDDLRQTIDWEAMAKFARLDFLIGLDVANAPARPRWNPGDVFERRNDDQ